MTADPYPEMLAEMDGDYPIPTPASPSQSTLLRAVTALERIANALEARQPVQNAPQRPPQTLAALPPVQVVADKPACPYHGLEKVRTSDKGPGFFCSAKALPGQPSNPKGYCTWHS